MKAIRYSILAIALAAAGSAAQSVVPQPSTDRGGSPYDRNPACQDRDVASTDSKCVIQDGPPLYRPLESRPQVAPPVPAQVQGGASPPVIVVVPQNAARQ